MVVVATTKVGIFKQITTTCWTCLLYLQLLLLPQRQEFSSKSQRFESGQAPCSCCCCYHKGRNFQANHNTEDVMTLSSDVVVATTKVGIFKQITTCRDVLEVLACCCCYHKGRNFQANHNCCWCASAGCQVVVATTKVGIFKQITT